MTIDEPFRFEGELFDLEIEGELPNTLAGTYFRIGPDQQFPPMLGDSNPFNGDGIVSAFRLGCLRDEPSCDCAVDISGWLECDSYVDYVTVGRQSA
jgi:hypothetical protein